MKTIKAEDSAFTIKYDQYSNMIYRLSLTYLKNAADCEDILQEVFVKLLSKGPDFKNLEHEKRWLLRITVNCCIDKIRKNERQDTLPLDESIFLSATPDEQTLAELVFQLPSKLKAPIHLHYYEGYKVNEISGILGIGTSAVKNAVEKGQGITETATGG